jgi:hypothetical protein
MHLNYLCDHSCPKNQQSPRHQTKNEIIATLEYVALCKTAEHQYSLISDIISDKPNYPYLNLIKNIVLHLFIETYPMVLKERFKFG